MSTDPQEEYYQNLGFDLVKIKDKWVVWDDVFCRYISFEGDTKEEVLNWLDNKSTKKKIVQREYKC